MAAGYRGVKPNRSEEAEPLVRPADREGKNSQPLRATNETEVSSNRSRRSRRQFRGARRHFDLSTSGGGVTLESEFSWSNSFRSERLRLPPQQQHPQWYSVCQLRSRPETDGSFEVVSN